jgi:hypothetical protein
MLSFLRRLRKTTEEIEAEAEGLIRDLDFTAYSAARQGERGASSNAIAKDWGPRRAGGRAQDGMRQRGWRLTQIISWPTQGRRHARDRLFLQALAFGRTAAAHRAVTPGL